MARTSIAHLSKHSLYGPTFILDIIALQKLSREAIYGMYGYDATLCKDPSFVSVTYIRQHVLVVSSHLLFQDSPSGSISTNTQILVNEFYNSTILAVPCLLLVVAFNLVVDKQKRD